MYLKIGKLELFIAKQFIRRSDHDHPILEYCRTPDGIEGCTRWGYYFAFSIRGRRDETNNRDGGSACCQRSVQEGMQG